MISIIGVLHGHDELEVRSVFRLEAESEIAGGRPLDLRAELVNADGRAVASGAVHALRSEAGCGCKGEGGGHGGEEYPLLVQALVPDLEAGAMLRIGRGDEPLWSRKAPARRPKLSAADAKLDDGALRLTWSVETSGEEEPECWAQWSSDRGRTWHALGVGLRDGSATLDARDLPAGSASIRLLASDGFHTVVSRTLAVRVPRRPPSVAILGPRKGQTFAWPGPMRLWAVATDDAGEVVADEAARWAIDGRAAATGLDVFVEAPKPGKHRATLTVRARGGRVEASVPFTTVEVAEERDEE